MPKPVPIQLAVEDSVSEAVLRKIIDSSGKRFPVPHTCYGKKGKNYLKSKILNYNHASRHVPFIVLTDLDATECAPVEIGQWLRNEPLNRNLLLRIAVREVESWILADRQAFADFFYVSQRVIPARPDTLQNAKRYLVNLVKSKSRKRDIRDDIVPPAWSTAEVGRDYNGCIGRFVRDFWNPKAAGVNSPSLARTIRAIERFKPVLPGSNPGTRPLA